MRFNGIIVAALGAALLAGAAEAQPPGGGRGAGAAEDAMEALLIVALKKDMGLETAAAADLAERARKLLVARQDFMREQHRLRRELDEVLDEAAAGDAAQVEALMAQLFEARGRFAAEQKRHFDELSRGMGPLERGRLFVSLERFEERLRRHLRRIEDRGGRRGEADADRPRRGARRGGRDAAGPERPGPEDL
jgi:hypothetical protein